MSSAVTPSFASASLYVGDLNINDVNETTLFEEFSRVGPVASIRVCRDAVTRRSLGYAYVNFHSVVDAEKALDTLNFTQIKGRPCRIMWSQRDPSIRKSGVGNIFIKNLDKSIDNKMLFDTFSMFGNILSCKIATSHSDGTSLGYGFVHFDSDEAAAKAIEKVNGMLLQDRAVVVASFAPKGSEKRPAGDKTKFTNIYVKELPDNCTKEMLDAFFSQYGVISNSALATRPQDNKKFAFVNFETPEQASAAVEQANDADFEGRKLVVCRAQKKSEREKELRDRYEQIKLDKMKRYVGLNLYVKNLTDDMGDAELMAEFSKFGEISSAKVMKDDATGRSRGFGFVCFVSAEDATRAVADMNQKMLGGKPLYVNLAMLKEDRRRQLEQQMRANKGMIAAGPGMYPGMAPQGMFYAPGQMPGRPNFMPYPHQMMGPQMGRGGFPGPRQFMGPPGGRPMQPAFALVPQAQNPMMPAVGRGARQSRPQGGMPAQGQTGQPPRPQGQAPMARAPVTGASRAQGQQGQNARYPNSRDQKGGLRQEGGSALLPGGAQPLTLATLVQAAPEMQKQLIGERLYPLIAVKQNEQAGKITGMLLEMDNTELLELLDSEEALDAKIDEALNVLREAEGQ